MRKLFINLLVGFILLFTMHSYAVTVEEAEKYIGETVTFEFFNSCWYIWEYQTIKGTVIIISNFWEGDIHLIIKVIQPVKVKDEIYSFPIDSIKEIEEINK